MVRKVKKKGALQKIDTPLYNYLQTLVLSFFSPQVYVDVGKRWKGFGIVYFMMMIFLFTLPLSLRVSIDFGAFINEQIIAPFKQIPPIQVQNGQASLDKPMPFFIKNKRNDVVAIIDTTGVVQAMDYHYPNLSLLITKDKLFYKMPSLEMFFSNTKLTGQVYEKRFDKDMNEVFDGKEWIKASKINHIKWLFIITMYPTVALVLFSVFLVFALPLGLMAQLIAKLFVNVTISYKQACRLLMVASTPTMFVLLLSLMLNLVFYGIGLLLLILLLGYFCFAVFCLKRASQRLVTL